MERLLKTNLFVGSIEDAFLYIEDEWAVVHATQTVHYKIFGWDKNNKPPKNHSNFLYYEEFDRLSFNWVDSKVKSDECIGIECFIDILDFIDKWIQNKKVCVHCDHGFSRSPSICLLYLAKRTNIISNDSFDQAKKEFVKIYHSYNPSDIAEYIKNNWNKII